MGIGENQWELDYRDLIAFTDSDYMGCPFSRRSTGGFAIYLYGNLIGFTKTKQKCNVTSFTVAEVLAILDATKELVWISSILKDINIEKGQAIMYCDSTCAMNQCKHPTSHKNTRHYENKLFYIRDTLKEENIQIEYIPTEINLADIFTKPLHVDKFERHCQQLLVLKN